MMATYSSSAAVATQRRHRLLRWGLLGGLGLLVMPLHARDLPYVAHAGGGYQNWQYTNTLQALDFNHDYFSLFEIDLVWTSDRRLVCLHDWDTNAEWIFGRRFEAPVSLEAFESLVAHHPLARNCTLETLLDWLKRHPGKRLVTDIKSDNLEGLSRLADVYGSGVGDQVIAQIYHPDEYAAARELGYRDIIWTLYRYAGDEAQIHRALQDMALYAVAMPRDWAQRGLARRLDVPSYVHTINTQREWTFYRSLGIQGIYTDWLPDPALFDEVE